MKKLARRLDMCLDDGKKANNYALPLDGDSELERTIHDNEALCLDATNHYNKKGAYCDPNILANNKEIRF